MEIYKKNKQIRRIVVSDSATNLTFLYMKIYTKKKKIQRIVVPHSATNLTLKKVKCQSHRMVPIERAWYKDHAWCQISMVYN